MNERSALTTAIPAVSVSEATIRETAPREAAAIAAKWSEDNGNIVTYRRTLWEQHCCRHFALVPEAEGEKA